MVRSASKNPSCRPYLKVRHWNPKCIGNGELWKWFGLDALNIVDNETETIAEVDNSCSNAMTDF